jgi:hypothetical protein
MHTVASSKSVSPQTGDFRIGTGSNSIKITPAAAATNANSERDIAISLKVEWSILKVSTIHYTIKLTLSQ